MLLGLHSFLFQTKMKVTTTSISSNPGLALSDSLRSPNKSAGQAEHQPFIENIWTIDKNGWVAGSCNTSL
jgi:hypothetical protein